MEEWKQEEVSKLKEEIFKIQKEGMNPKVNIR